MGLRIALLHGRSIPISYKEAPSSLSIWRQYYRPPFHTCFQIFSIITSFLYLFTVLVPVQTETQILRNVFKDIFFLEKHESPVSKASDLNDYYQELETSAENIKDDFILKAKFPNESTLVYHTITFLNGSTSLEFHPEVDPESLKNITTIESSIPIYLYSSRKPVLACSIWELLITVSDKYSNPAFYLSSELFWHQCKLDENQTALGEKIERSKLPFYRNTVHWIKPLFLLSTFHSIFLIHYFYARSKMHREWRKSDPTYQEMKSIKQFHFTFGFWPICELISSLSLIVTTTILLDDARTMTEYPMLIVMKLYSISNAFLFLTALQWFNFNSWTYHYVAILREGALQIFSVAISFLPVIFAFFFVGIFLFANIADKSRSYFSMLTILVSFTLGDNIEPTYNDFSDGSVLFNWLAFAYITLLVLVAGWVVFASFTAVVSFIDRKLMMKQHLHKD